MATRSRPAAPAPSDRCEVSCLVDAADDAAFAAIADRAERAGLHVEQRLAAIGVLTGTVARGDVAALEAVPGIDAVELVREVSLTPPGATGR